MPLWSGVVGILRRRLILGIIFSLSVIYCGLSLYSDRKGLSFRSSNDYTNSKSLIDDNSIDIVDDDDINLVSDKIIWSSDSLNQIDNEISAEKDVYNVNKTDASIKKSCQNSVQGKTLIVDDRGYVCPRLDILPNGCCKVDQDKSIKNDLYSCKSCNYLGCCAIYEYCVSCCLNPAKHLKIKKKSDIDSRNKDTSKKRRGEDILKLKIRNLDRFQICLAACRTSSASVRHENTYKDPHLKFCYITNPVASSVDTQHVSRRDLISVNKNVDLSVVVPTTLENSTEIVKYFVK